MRPRALCPGGRREEYTPLWSYRMLHASYSQYTVPADAPIHLSMVGHSSDKRPGLLTSTRLPRIPQNLWLVDRSQPTSTTVSTYVSVLTE